MRVSVSMAEGVGCPAFCGVVDVDVGFEGGVGLSRVLLFGVLGALGVVVVDDGVVVEGRGAPAEALWGPVVEELGEDVVVVVDAVVVVVVEGVDDAGCGVAVATRPGGAPANITSPP